MSAKRRTTQLRTPYSVLRTSYSPLSPPPSPFPLPPSAFTLVELLVTITIIGILAAMVMGALQAARQTAKEYATKATILKLNNIIMQRYESYMTRRVPISTSGLPPTTAAQLRLAGIRQLMRMEMPDHWSDIFEPRVSGSDPAVADGNGVATVTGTLPSGTSVSRTLSRPALSRIYAQRYNAGNPMANYEPAKCLYLLVSIGSPEAMEQFHQSEITVDPADGWAYFVDGWGKPIFFLRWAPGFNASDVQPNISIWTNTIEKTNATGSDHDPFDSRKVDTQHDDETSPGTNVPTGWRTVPLIYSWGSLGNTNSTGVFIGGSGYRYNDNPYISVNDGGVIRGLGSPTGPEAVGLITNHHIEQR